MISFIKLLNEAITLSQAEKDTFKEAYRQMGLDEEWAEYDFAELLKWLEELPQTIILYRLIYVDEEIDKEELGAHYSHIKKDLLHNHHSRGSIYSNSEMGENALLLTVKIKKDQIDIFNTLHNNIMYPHEQEITLKNKGKGSELIDVSLI
jgi:hypothetical protein